MKKYFQIEIAPITTKRNKNIKYNNSNLNLNKDQDRDHVEETDKNVGKVER